MTRPGGADEVRDGSVTRPGRSVGDRGAAPAPAGRRAASRGRRSGDRGSVSVEVAILAPAFFALIALGGVAGRTAVAAEAVESAAHDAARAASISRDPGTGADAARDAARAQLDWRGLNCTQPPSVTLRGWVGRQQIPFEQAYATGAGEPSAVSVRISCVVSFTDLKLPGLAGMPTRRTVTAEFTSPLDRYRSRP